jgi:general secretion pathway protein G
MRGFTLVELVVTLAILAMLSMIVVPAAQISLQRSKEHELRRSLLELRRAIDEYKRAVDQGAVRRDAKGSGYPPSLAVLAEGVEDQRSARREKIYFLRRVPRDPFHPEPTVPAEQTWGKRSYASGPDNPQEGDDIYDVFSRSGQTGLNGVPYAKW